MHTTSAARPVLVGGGWGATSTSYVNVCTATAVEEKAIMVPRRVEAIVIFWYLLWFATLVQLGGTILAGLGPLGP